MYVINENNKTIKYILENHDINNANDIVDTFKNIIQTMLNAESETSIGYDKNSNKIEKIMEIDIRTRVLEVNLNYLCNC